MLLSCPKVDEIADAARELAAQRDFVVADSTRAKNRLRAILFESCPTFDQIIDLTQAWCLNLVEKLGESWQVADAAAGQIGALTRGVDRRKVARLVEPFLIARNNTSETIPLIKLARQLVLPRIVNL